MANNLWKSFANNTTAFGHFEHPTDKVKANCGPYNYGHVYGPRPYNPFDMDWVKGVLSGYNVDLYTYTLTWKDNVAEVEMDIPGVKKDEISVTFEPDHLLIKSKRKNIESKRTVGVDTAGLDHDKCSAILEDGVLSLKLVRKEPVKKTLTIK